VAEPGKFYAVELHLKLNLSLQMPIVYS
jgi:hypothetical protein